MKKKTKVYDGTYKAYALGFHAGYRHGYWNDLYFNLQAFSDVEYHAAKAGYDAGVAHYCDVHYSVS
jgi:hypothetical protein